MNLIKFLPLLSTIALVPLSGRAASVAADNAANSPYSDGWQTGDNGGSGWGSAWTLTPSGSGATFLVGNSTAGGDGDINTPQTTSGQAWGLGASTGTTATASRSFAGMLTATQTFSVDYDSSTLGSGASAGIRLVNASGNTLWEFDYDGGNGIYTIDDASGNGAKSASVTTQGVHIAFTLTSGTAYSLSVTPLGSSSTGHTGSLISASGGTDIAGFALFFSGNAASTTTNEQFFNNISVVPEPSAFAFACAASVITIFWGAFKRSKTVQIIRMKQ